MDTFAVSFQVTAKPTPIPITLKYLPTFLTGDTIIITYSFIVLAVHLSIGIISKFACCQTELGVVCLINLPAC